MAAPRKDDVAQLILSSTEALLQERAFSDISLAEIARKSGIAKGTLYYHYKSKEEILFALMDLYLEEQWRDLLLWTSDKSKDTSLPRLMKYILERDTSTADMRFHFFYDAISGNEAIRTKLVERYRRFAQLISEKIRERTDQIDASYLAWTLLMLSDGLLMHKMLGNEEIDTAAFIRQTELYLKQLFQVSQNGTP